jgi:hypothetical protein
MTCTSLFVAFAAAAMAPLAAAQSNCCEAQVKGVGCDDPTCQDAVCSADAFCCETLWDGACAASAQTLCPDLCGGGGGSTCCTAQQTPGCDDTACQDLICAQDSFCCNNTWDQVCADAAIAQCEVCGGGGGNPACPGTNDCCVASPDGTAGCSDEACCNAVCAADSFCCSTQWDAICASQAVGLCGCVVTCPESDHDCYTEGIPGCTDVDCCALVCSADSFCCSTAWDGLCVSQAFSFCGFPKCEYSCEGTPENEPCGLDLNGGCNVSQGGTSNCCVANGGVGCDDLTCQDAVCAADSFCCTTSWDGICADEANLFCPDICFTNPPMFGVLECGETLCGDAWASGNIRDTDWFILNVPGAGAGTEVTVTVTSQLPMLIGLINSTDCATATGFTVSATSGFCGSATFTYCMVPGENWIFAAPNTFDGFPCESGYNGYTLTVECGGDCLPIGCGNAGHDCYTVGGPYCDDVDCCELVCSIDPFCCDTSWDGICVDEAVANCGAPKCPIDCVGTDEGEDCGTDSNGGCNVPVIGDSNCCTGWGGLGCDDEACSLAVCAADSFCCTTAWDGICADSALILCPDICQIGVPNFGEIGCNETICGTAWADANLRDTDWYILTLDADTQVTISMQSQLPMIFGLINSTDCATATAIDPNATTGICGSNSLVVDLPAGTHWIFAAPTVFAGYPCESGFNDYALSISCPIDCVSGPDRDGSGCVDGADISTVLGNWDPTGALGNGLGVGDANCDGVVDGADLAIVLGAWLTGPNCP